MAAKPAPTHYILHGDDIFTLEEEVAAMRARMGDDPATADLNMASFDGRTATLADVFNAVSALPFLSDRRLVIVDGWLSWLSRSGAGKAGKETLEAIAAQLPNLPDWARLVFVERTLIKDSNPVLKAARSDPRGYIKTFRQPQNPLKWIEARAAHYDVAIEGRAASVLAELASGDLLRLDNELFKLAAFVGAGETITTEHVAQLTTYVPEESIFAMVDALGRRDARTAARIMQRLRSDTEALSLLGMIIRQFRLLLQAREHLDLGGGRGPALAQALHVHSFVAQKLEQQSRNFELDDLEAIYRHLLALDREIKTGQIDPDLALDMLVARLSAEEA
ncbi:MAG: DNA polymerase III subunit delta [Anaerolineae bacterium]